MSALRAPKIILSESRWPMDRPEHVGCDIGWFFAFTNVLPCLFDLMHASVPHAFPGRIIKASNLSSSPLPNPSRSHSPPPSSNNAMLSLSLPCIDPVLETFPKPFTLGMCGGGSDEAHVMNDDRGTVDVGVDARRSV